MKKALLLHGWEGRSTDHWFPWLRKELEGRGFSVFSPDLPNTDWPVLAEQINCIGEYAQDFGKGDIVVGHSLGCTLATHFIEKNNFKGLQVFLVAPTYPQLSVEKKEMFGEYYKTLNAYYGSNLSFQGLGNEYKIFLSDNDKYISIESATEYYKALPGKVDFRHFSGYGHFMESDGITELPEILDYII